MTITVTVTVIVIIVIVIVIIVIVKVIVTVIVIVMVMVMVMVIVIVIVIVKTSEIISDSAECYARVSVRFESSAALCNLLVQGSKITCQDGRGYCGLR